MTWDELGDYFETLSENLLEDVPDIIAETATEHFKERFQKKEFDGNPWPAAKVPKRAGSLLVESGNLVNSIRPAYVGKDKVVISAGNDKVVYAQVHNEGYQGPVTIPAHTRRTKKGIASVQQHTRTVDIPQRQFMGKANELLSLIYARITNAIQSRL